MTPPAETTTTREPKTSDVAGRVFRFSEGTERCLVDRMRDLDEIVAQMKELYPENTWSRSDLLTLFFLDDIGDGILRLVQRDTEA